MLALGPRRGASAHLSPRAGPIRRGLRDSRACIGLLATVEPISRVKRRVESETGDSLRGSAIAQYRCQRLLAKRARSASPEVAAAVDDVCHRGPPDVRAE